MALILGLESSCDETAAAIVSSDRRLLSHALAGQEDHHRPYGGVVPEIAARAHAEILADLVAAALADAGVTLDDIDAVAATAGPGLIGGVMVGLVTGKALAMAAGKPLIAVNHLEGHALSPRLTDDSLDFPYLLLLVSGGHCQLLRVDGVGQYRRLATTIDDAVGEAFDKTAKLLGLGFPGGPAVEAAALRGDPAAVPLPRPLKGSAEPHFSFAGLKSAVARAVASGNHPPADVAASFQAAVCDCLEDRIERALAIMQGAAGGTAAPSTPRFAGGPPPRAGEELATSLKSPPARGGEPPASLAVGGNAALLPSTLVVAGGVAANAMVRARLAALAARHDMRFVAPPLWLCTDNGAMIAWAGAERLALGLTDGLDVAARPRWPLDPDAEAVRGAGVKA